MAERGVGSVSAGTHRPSAIRTWSASRRWGPSMADSTDIRVHRVNGGTMTLRYGKNEVEIPADAVETVARMIESAAAWTDNSPGEQEGS